MNDSAATLSTSGRCRHNWSCLLAVHSLVISLGHGLTRCALPKDADRLVPHVFVRALPTAKAESKSKTKSSAASLSTASRSPLSPAPPRPSFPTAAGGPGARPPPVGKLLWPLAIVESSDQDRERSRRGKRRISLEFTRVINSTPGNNLEPTEKGDPSPRLVLGDMGSIRKFSPEWHTVPVVS